MKKRVMSNVLVEHSIHHKLRPVFNHLKSKDLVKNNNLVINNDLKRKSKFNSFAGFVILILAVFSLVFSISLSYSGVTGFISNDSSGSISGLIGVLLFIASILGFYLYLMREK